jgi:archaeal type IV pilus assembly protein PilA
MINKNSEAVSPVVGVMLMLVVVIIIAAVVSAFAGGMASSKDKSPTVSIRGTYSQTDGLKIEHLGGSAVPTINTIIQVRPSKTFGNAEHMVWVVNKTSVTDISGKESSAWLRAAGYSGTKSFSSGDIAYIVPPYHTSDFLQPGTSATYMFNSTTNVGKTFWIEFADENGRVFARTEVPITR